MADEDPVEETYEQLRLPGLDEWLDKVVIDDPPPPNVIPLLRRIRREQQAEAQ